MLMTNYLANINLDVEETVISKGFCGLFREVQWTLNSVEWHTLKKDVSTEEDDEPVYAPLTEDDLDQPEYKDDKITITSNGLTRTFRSMGGFLVGHLFDCVLELEKEARPVAKHFGGRDHIAFVGLKRLKFGDYMAQWDS